MKKYLLILLIIKAILLVSTFAYTEEQKSEKTIPEDIAMEAYENFIVMEEVLKKNKMSFDEMWEIKLELWSCDEKNYNHENLITKGKKNLKVYRELIDQRENITDKKNYIETISHLSWCYRNLASKEGTHDWVNLVREAIDSNILSIDVLFNSYEAANKSKKLEIFHDSIWMWYSVFVSEKLTYLNETPQQQWVYDKKILEILTKFAKLIEFHNFVWFSKERFNNSFARPKVINSIEKNLNLGDLNDRDKSFKLFKIYLGFLVANKDFSKCENFYNTKIKLINFSHEEVIRKIDFHDSYFQCLFAQIKLEQAFNAINEKPQYIKDALNNYKFNSDDEFTLYDHLVRSIYSSAFAEKEKSYNIENEKKYENLIAEATQINKEYFFDKYPFKYYMLNKLFLNAKVDQGKFYEVQNEINLSLKEIKKLSLENYHGDGLNFLDEFDEIERVLATKEDLFKASKYELEVEYLSLYASVLKKTGNYQEAKNVYEKALKSKIETGKLLEINYEGELTPSIDTLQILQIYSDLFEFSIVFNNESDSKKYIKIFDKYCGNPGIGKYICLEYYNFKISYYQKNLNFKGTQNSFAELEKIWSTVNIANPYIQYFYKINFLKNRLFMYASLEAEILKKEVKDKKSIIEYNQIKENICNTSNKILQLAKRQIDLASKDEKISEEIEDRLSLILAGALYVKIGTEGLTDCKVDTNFTQDLQTATEKIIEIQKKNIYKNINFTSNFSRYEVKSELISQLAAIFASDEEEDFFESSYAQKKLKELFSLSQVGKNLYLTNSIKSSLSEEKIENVKLKKLVTKKNLLNRRIEELTKDMFNDPKTASNAFEIQSEFKNEVSKIENLININFPNFINNKKIKLYTVEDVQRNLKENQALIVFDSSDFYFSYIIQKNDFSVHVDNRVTKSGLREFIREYRKIINPKKKSKISEQQNILSAFYRGLFEKLKNKLNSNIDQLIIVTDKHTEGLPLGILFDKNENKYLIEKYSIIYAPSVGIFVELKNNKKEKLISTSSNFLGVGNPKLQKTSIKQYVKAITDFSLTPRGILSDQSLINEHFNNLPFTKKEIEELSKFFSNNKLLLSSEANEKQIKNLDLKKYDIISFATHAAVSGELKGFNEPFLVLTPPKFASELNDGILTASEISQLKLNANVVILSACNTASKENQYSPGFSGLVASFIKAGAKNVIATHWQVADKASSIMIIETFKKTIDNKIDLSQSLQETKKEFIQGKYGEKYKNPAYWGSYIIIGN